MTNTAHKRLFSAIDNFHKINLPSFFPFVAKTSLNQGNTLKSNQRD